MIFIPMLGPILSMLGPVATKVTTALLTNLPKIVETALNVMKVVSAVVQTVAEIKGLSPHGENPEELGAKTLQDGTRAKMEDESMENYLNYLRNEVSLDKEKMRSMTNEDKLRCNAIGTGMLSQAISEKCEIEISGDFILDIAKMKMTGEQMSRYIDAFSENGINSLDSLTKYLRGQLDESKSESVEAIIEKVESQLNPDKTEGEILVSIEEMKERLN